MIMNVEMHFSLKHFLHLATLFYVCGEFRSLVSTHTANPFHHPHPHLLAGWVKTTVETPLPQHYSYPPYPTLLHTFINNSHITSSDKQRFYEGMANLYTIILIFAKGSSPLFLLNQRKASSVGLPEVFFISKNIYRYDKFI